MNHGQVAGVFMSGPLAGFRAALQDGLWNLTNERIDERRGTLQGCKDHTYVIHGASGTNTTRNDSVPASTIQLVHPTCGIPKRLSSCALAVCASPLFL